MLLYCSVVCTLLHSIYIRRNEERSCPGYCYRRIRRGILLYTWIFPQSIKRSAKTFALFITNCQIPNPKRTVAASCYVTFSFLSPRSLSYLTVFLFFYLFHSRPYSFYSKRYTVHKLTYTIFTYSKYIKYNEKIFFYLIVKRISCFRVSIFGRNHAKVIFQLRKSLSFFWFEVFLPGFNKTQYMTRKNCNVLLNVDTFRNHDLNFYMQIYMCH